MSETTHLFASDFLLETVGGLRDTKKSDAAGIDGSGKTTYNVSLRIDGRCHTYTIERAETPLQAMLKAIERVLLSTSTHALRKAELVEVISVRESA